MKVLGTTEVSLILNIAIASLKIPYIRFEQTEGLFQEARGQLHIILYGRIGGGKSRILNEICKNQDITPTVSITKAHLFGTVEKETGQFIPPIIWTNRDNFVAIDEFHINPNKDSNVDVLNTLLQLSEDPSYNKQIGYRCNEVSMTSNGLYCKVKRNRIQVKTRFALLINTMMNLRTTQSHLLKALVSRCICIPHYPSFDELINALEGARFYNFDELEIGIKDFTVSNKDYKLIIDYIKGHKPKVKEEILMRSVMDLCRVFVVLGKHDAKIYDLIITLKNQMNYKSEFGQFGESDE